MDNSVRIATDTNITVCTIWTDIPEYWQGGTQSLSLVHIKLKSMILSLEILKG